MLCLDVVEVDVPDNDNVGSEEKEDNLKGTHPLSNLTNFHPPSNVTT